MQLSDLIVLQNTTQSPAFVRLLGASGTATTPEPAIIGREDILVPPGRTVTRPIFGLPLWVPADVPRRWIVHVDIPPGVAIQSRLELAPWECPFTSPLPPDMAPRLGRVVLPVFRSLAPPGAVQRLLGSDAGFAPADVSIGVFNGARTAATAHLEFRRACDDALADVATLEVPGNALVEHTFTTAPPACNVGPGEPAPWVYYTVVVVDQPSLTYALSVPRTNTPTIGVSAPAEIDPPARRRAITFHRPQ